MKSVTMHGIVTLQDTCYSWDFSWWWRRSIYYYYCYCYCYCYYYYYYWVCEDVACCVVGIWDIDSPTCSTAWVSCWCFPCYIRRYWVSPTPATSRSWWVQVICHQTLSDYQVFSKHM